jgi:hypothetical protein
MPWYGYVIMGYIAFIGLATIYFVGEPREPIKPRAAVIVVLIKALMIWGIWELGS